MEISFSANDAVLSFVLGARSTRLTGFHAATGRSIAFRGVVNSRGTAARAVSHQGVRRANSLRGTITGSARTFARNTVGGWKSAGSDTSTPFTVAFSGKPGIARCCTGAETHIYAEAIEMQGKCCVSPFFPGISSTFLASRCISFCVVAT